MKKISILGSTGSIGTQTLEVIENDRDNFEIVGLSAYSNTELLIEQIKKYTPKIVCIHTEEDATCIRQTFPHLKVLSQKNGILEIASHNDNDIVVNAIVGFAGLESTIMALQKNKIVALANKESLVTGGSIIQEILSKKSSAKIFPIDSEHSAIFQCLQGNPKNRIEKIILTCSGGPFLNTPEEKIIQATVNDALKHPNWDMGKRISIDSATFVNKGLEVIEAAYLFDLSPDQIDVVVHPQSKVHSFIQYTDGNILAQVSPPDMRMAISYVLYYPDRGVNTFERLNLFGETWNFLQPDTTKFPCLEYAYTCLRAGGTLPTAFNAADEAAVELFLQETIGFRDIEKIILHCIENHQNITNPTLEDIIKTDEEIREHVFSQFS